MSQIDRLWNLVTGLIFRAKSPAVTQQNGRQIIQFTGYEGETRNDVELIQPAFMSARPGPNADFVVFCTNGTADHMVAMGGDDTASRITDLETGEFGFQSNSGRQMVFRQDGLQMATPTVRIAGNLEAAGGITRVVTLQDGGTLVFTNGLLTGGDDSTDNSD